MKHRLLLGSTNSGKLNEFKFYFKHFKIFKEYDLITLSNFDNIKSPEENGKTFEENAKKKSKYFFNHTNLTTISDDSGFIVKELVHYPGIRTARVAKDLGGEQSVIDYIFSLFKNKDELQATFYCALSLVNSNNELTCIGSVDGKIIPYKKGVNGFGYDPFFIPNKEKKTFAEMDRSKKMLSSHRYTAFKNLISRI